MAEKKLLLFGGTIEGRRLSERLAAAGVPHILCVATEYGTEVMQPHPLTKIREGRLTEAEMGALIQRENVTLVVDATHPYAREVSKNIRSACAGRARYLRLLRDGETGETAYCRYVADAEECAARLREMDGNILLTTGSKELSPFTADATLRERLFVRVLPSMESIRLCEAQGIRGRQILALQGPFSQEMNEALLRQYDIRVLVTKQSGAAGGFPEKLAAAGKREIPCLVIGRPEEEGLSFAQVLRTLGEEFSVSLGENPHLEISLLGCGAGNAGSLSVDGSARIREADILLGAERLLKSFGDLAGRAVEKQPYYLSRDILPYLSGLAERFIYRDTLRVCVLFSGDSGFYSGAKQLAEGIREALAEEKLQGRLSVYPGLSSVSLAAARLQESYQDACIMSIHGKQAGSWEAALLDAVRTHEKCCVLLSGAKDAAAVSQLLFAEGPEAFEIALLYQMGYPEERLYRIRRGQPLTETLPEGLYLGWITNPGFTGRILSYGLTDDRFQRDRVPMTKEEVRSVILSKLRLREGAVLYDIGSGTGSVAIEAARLSPKLSVFAIEKKETAQELLLQNQALFQLRNIQLVRGEAPEVLQDLPAPTHVFIGGSGGELSGILSALYQKNAGCRVVISAVTLETMGAIPALREQFPIREESLVQLQVSRGEPVGRYHLWKGQNPVLLYSFCFGGGNAGDAS